MEQSSIAPERSGLIVAVAEDIFVWIVGPRRSVNKLFYLRRLEIILLA